MQQHLFAILHMFQSTRSLILFYLRRLKFALEYYTTTVKIGMLLCGAVERSAGASKFLAERRISCKL